MQVSRGKIGKIKFNYGALSLVLFYCNDFFEAVFQRLFHNSAISQGVCLFLIYGSLTLCISKNKKALKNDGFLVIIAISLLFLLSYMIFPENQSALTQLKSWNALHSVFTFSSGIFAYFFFRLLDNDDLLYKTLKPCAYFLLIWAAFRINSAIANGGFYRTFENGIQTSNSYDMSTGYRLLFVSIFFGLQFIENKTVKRYLYLALAAISFVGMLIYGSRTAAISWVLFWVLRYLFCREEKYSVNKLLFIIFLFLLSVIITSPAVLQGISGVLLRLGVNSRSLNSLVSQELTLDIGRSRMWKTSIEKIMEHPIFGNGIFADRAWFGIYCHQIFLEILIDFGCVLGGLFIILLLAKMIKGLTIKNIGRWKLLYVLFFSMCVVRLMLSSSFWLDTNFWAMLGILVSFEKEVKRDEHRVK